MRVLIPLMRAYVRTCVLLFHPHSPSLYYSLIPSRFHISIRSSAHRLSPFFFSSRKESSVKSSHLWTRFRVRVRTPVCVSPGQVNVLATPGAKRRRRKKGGEQGRKGKRENARNTILQILRLHGEYIFPCVCYATQKNRVQVLDGFARSSYIQNVRREHCAAAVSSAVLFNSTCARFCGDRTRHGRCVRRARGNYSLLKSECEAGRAVRRVITVDILLMNLFSYFQHESLISGSLRANLRYLWI